MGDLMHILETAINAVVPVVLIVLLGYCLKERGFLSKEFVKVGSKVSFRVAMPIMLFVNVYNIESFDVIQWEVVIYSMVAILVIFLLGMITVIFTTDDPKRKGAVLQATFRSNNAIVGLSLASVLGGPEAVAVASVVSAFTLPIMNIFAVIALTIYVNDDGTKKIDIMGILKKIAKNPLIIGCVIGMILLLGGIKLPTIIDKAMSDVGKAGTPVALFLLGASFSFSAVRGNGKDLTFAVAMKLVVVPLIFVGAAVLMGFRDVALASILIAFGAPTAVSSFTMAQQMDGDDVLAGQIVVFTTLLSVVSLVAFIFVFKQLGLV